MEAGRPAAGPTYLDLGPKKKRHFFKIFNYFIAKSQKKIAPAACCISKKKSRLRRAVSQKQIAPAAHYIVYLKKKSRLRCAVSQKKNRACGALYLKKKSRLRRARSQKNRICGALYPKKNRVCGALDFKKIASAMGYISKKNRACGALHLKLFFTLRPFQKRKPCPFKLKRKKRKTCRAVDLHFPATIPPYSWTAVGL